MEDSDAIREHSMDCKKCRTIPDKYVNIFKALYKDSACCIRMGNRNTRMFNITTGVRQGCVLSTFLFLMVVDFIMRKAINNPMFGIEWGTGRLADLDFADDVGIAEQNTRWIAKNVGQYTRDRI